VKRPQEALLAYIATLIAIVLLTLAAAIMVETADLETERGIAKLIGALSFIASAVSGLIGVIGTFRPKGQNEGSE
jgi:hypothetical protein